MLPSYDDICLPLLAELSLREGRSRPRDERNGQTIYTALANYFALTPTDLSEKVYEENGTPRSKWENMVRWARNDLKKRNILIAPSHGVWAIGDAGLAYLNRKCSALRFPYSASPFDGLARTFPTDSLTRPSIPERSPFPPRTRFLEISSRPLQG